MQHVGERKEIFKVEVIQIVIKVLFFLSVNFKTIKIASSHNERTAVSFSEMIKLTLEMEAFNLLHLKNILLILKTLSIIEEFTLIVNSILKMDEYFLFTYFTL